MDQQEHIETEFLRKTKTSKYIRLCGISSPMEANRTPKQPQVEQSPKLLRSHNSTLNKSGIIWKEGEPF